MGLGQLHAPDGSPVAFEIAAQRLAGVDVVLFGELHGNAVVHEMERRMGAELLRLRGRDLVLGAEMFEADDQIVLDEYLSGLILHHHLTSEAKVWENYETDYRPLVELAKAGGIPFAVLKVSCSFTSTACSIHNAEAESAGSSQRRIQGCVWPRSQPLLETLRSSSRIPAHAEASSSSSQARDP